jgi:peptidoglycan/LPS O-acetylase OafA/YrhL
VGFLLVFPIASFFVAGAVIRLIYDRGLILPKWPARVLELAALACFIRYASMSWFAYVPADFANPVALLKLASSVCYFALAISPTSLTTMCLKSSPALYLGTVSYSLYLVHPYSYYACRGLFESFGLFTDDHVLSMALFYLVTTPVTLLATHVIHKTLEMKPYEWVFHQRIYRSGSSRRPTAEPASKLREVSAVRPETS